MPAAATIEDTTVIEAHDLALKKEQNDEWYVGREDLGSFIALPEIWAQAVIYMSMKSPLTNQAATDASFRPGVTLSQNYNSTRRAPPFLVF